MTTMSASQARIPTKAFNNVVYKGERIRVKRRDGETVVLVSEDDLALLEALEGKLGESVKKELLEDQDDLAEARRALKNFKKSGRKGIPLEEVARELGIELPRK